MDTLCTINLGHVAAQGAQPIHDNRSVESTVSKAFTDSSKELSISADSVTDVDSSEKRERLRLETLSELPSPWTRRFGTFLKVAVFTVYRQLLAGVCIANMVAIVVVVARASRSTGSPLADMATAAMANLTVAILVRQDYVRNMLFHACWSIPHSAPLWMRRRLAKVYENGGVHCGGAVCAVGWHIAFVSVLTGDVFQHRSQSDLLLWLSYALLAILAIIVCLAVPQVRSRHHNLFENSHRLGGWLCILIFWPILVLFVRSETSKQPDTTLAYGLARSPAFWLLVVTSVHVIYPWVLLRKVPVVKVEFLSDHAVRLYFSSKEKIKALHGLAISDAVLREWHSFAAIPDLDGADGGASSCIISKAGDWTAKTVERPAEAYYMRGCHMTGALHMAKVFRRVVIMATGSGVGPCLALFGHAQKTSIRFIWFASAPRNTFGDRIVDRVLRQDPEATIWDTSKEGQRRPNLAQMAHQMFIETEAEAVFFISNKRLTKRVVLELETRGVPTYAPVFDS